MEALQQAIRSHEMALETAKPEDRQIIQAMLNSMRRSASIGVIVATGVDTGHLKLRTDDPSDF